MTVNSSIPTDDVELRKEKGKRVDWGGTPYIGARKKINVGHKLGGAGWSVLSRPFSRTWQLALEAPWSLPRDHHLNYQGAHNVHLAQGMFFIFPSMKCKIMTFNIPRPLGPSSIQYMMTINECCASLLSLCQTERHALIQRSVHGKLPWQNHPFDCPNAVCTIFLLLAVRSSFCAVFHNFFSSSLH